MEPLSKLVPESALGLQTICPSDLGSISPTFYEQLLPTQIPKAQKKDSQVKQLFALLGSASIKAVRKHVDEIDSRLPINNVIYSEFSNYLQPLEIKIVCCPLTPWKGSRFVLRLQL